MSHPRLSGIAAVGALALVLGGCAGEEPVAVGIDTLHIATLGPVDPAQQAFIDRMGELSEGTIAVEVTENFPGGEVALTEAVEAGEVDLAWTTVRSLSALDVDGLDALEAPLLIQTHDQQRAIALGVPGELITNALRDTRISAMALLPGPQQYLVANGAPVITLADWAGKTVQVSSLSPIEQRTVEALGATAATDGPSTVADLVSGSAQATTADPRDLVPGGVSATGPFMTANVSLWPRMSIVIVNNDILDRLSNRQNGFLQGSVVRSQDLSMADPDLATPVADACKAGAKFGIANAAQQAELLEAVQPVYQSLESDPADKRMLEAIQESVKRHAGTGALSIAKACRYVAPK